MQGPLRLNKRGGNKSSPTRGDDSRKSEISSFPSLERESELFLPKRRLRGESQSDSAPPGKSAQPADTIRSTLTQQHAHRLRSGYLPEAKVPVLHVRYGNTRLVTPYFHRTDLFDKALWMYMYGDVCICKCMYVQVGTGLYRSVHACPCRSLYVFICTFRVPYRSDFARRQGFQSHIRRREYGVHIFNTALECTFGWKRKVRKLTRRLVS